MLLIETGDVEGQSEKDNGMDYLGYNHGEIFNQETTGYNCCAYWGPVSGKKGETKCLFGAVGQLKCTGECGGKWLPMKISFFVKHNLRKYTCKD